MDSAIHLFNTWGLHSVCLIWIICGTVYVLNHTPVDRKTTLWPVRACLHGGGGPQIGEVACGELPHLLCKRDQIKLRDYMNRQVTSPTWGPPPLCKQALKPSDFFLISGKVEPFAVCSSPLIHLVCPPPPTKKIIHVVFNFSCEDCNTQKKFKTKVVQAWREGGGGE